MLHNVETLQGIYRCCRAGQQLSTDQRHWLGASLGRWLMQECGSLNEAFGLLQGHGGVPWWRERAIRQRDAELRALAALFFADVAVCARAREITRIASRYETTNWPRDRQRTRMPESYRGTAREYLWRAFRSGAKMPVTERRLRTVLAE